MSGSGNWQEDVLRDGRLLDQHIRESYRNQFFGSRLKTDIFWEMLSVLFLLFSIFGVIGLMSLPFVGKALKDGRYLWKRGKVTGHKLGLVHRSVNLYVIVDGQYDCNLLGLNLFYPTGMDVFYIQLDEGLLRGTGIVLQAMREE